MWSRKPDAGLARALAGAVERQRQADVGLAGLALDRRRVRLMAPRFSRMRASIDSAWTLEALGARDRRARGRQLAAAAAPIAHLGHAPAEVARREHRGEARGAAGRQARGSSPRRSRRTPSRSPRRRTGSRRERTARRQRLGVRRRSAAGARARTRSASSSAASSVGGLDERERRVADVGRSTTSRAIVRERVEQRRRRRRPRRRGCPRRARPARACPARPARPRARPRRRRARPAGRSDRRSRRCRRRAESWRLASCT